MSEQTENERYLTRTGAARYLNVCARTIDRLSAERRIATVCIGRRRLYDVRDLDGFAQSCKVPAGAV